MHKELQRVLVGLLNDYRIVLNETKVDNTLVGELLDFSGEYKTLILNDKEWQKKMRELHFAMSFDQNVVRFYYNSTIY